METNYNEVYNEPSENPVMIPAYINDIETWVPARIA